MTRRKNAKNTPGRPFETGNPGRPKGARNKTTMAAEALLDGEAEGLTRKAIELALEGDMAALKLCLDRIVPVRKTRPVKFHLPTIETPDDVLKAMQSIIQSVADGDTTPDDAQSVMALLDQTRRTQEHVDFDKRLTALENLQ